MHVDEVYNTNSILWKYGNLNVEAINLFQIIIRKKHVDTIKEFDILILRRIDHIDHMTLSLSCTINHNVIREMSALQNCYQLQSLLTFYHQ